MTLEWQVSSPPPFFNFDEIPQVVGSPYEYGVPGARHAVFNGDRTAQLEEVQRASRPDRTTDDTSSSSRTRRSPARS